MHSRTLGFADKHWHVESSVIVDQVQIGKVYYQYTFLSSSRLMSDTVLMIQATQAQRGET